MSELKDIDLSAWEVPEPPTDLADSVVARLDGTDITPAVPVEAPKRRSRALLIGGVAAAVVVATLGVWTLVASSKRAAPTSGTVVAQAAQQLSLDGVTAELDAGANVKWTRDARTLHVQQRTGSAAWRIGADQRLVITAGPSTVEALGASSLRVEVKMNSVERVVGASAFAAAAIAMTVIVYDGKVTVENPQHERVVVAPGTTYKVEPPVDKKLVGAADCSVDSCILTNYADACCARYKPIKDALDRADISEGIALVRAEIDACGDQHPASGTVKVTVRVASRVVVDVKVTDTPDVALGQCVADVIKTTAVFPAANSVTTFAYPFVFPAQKASCDGKSEREAGDDAMARGAHAEALEHYEAALQCVADPTYERLAYVAACNARDQAAAKKYFRRLPEAGRDRYRLMCTRNNVDVDDSKTACDADALKAEAVELMGQGQHAGALAKLETAIACRASPQLEALAFASACSAKDVTLAQVHYSRLSGSEQDRLRPICARNNIVLSVCDAAALKAKGVVDLDIGKPALALDQFEDSLRCKQDPDVVALAGQAACKANNAEKVKQYNATCSSCDADGLKDKGMEQVNMGRHAAALAEFEASLRCKQDSYVVALAFMAACNGGNAPKARQFYGQLTPKQQPKYKVMCDRNHIDVTPCDADALKDAGMQQVNEGNHAKALAQFEQSLACKADPYVDQLAFMEACSSRNATKARAYYAKLTPAQQTKYEVICERNKVVLVDDSKGYLEVFSTPAAKIFIDGVDTGLTTPIRGKALALTPGKHKVTYVIGGDRYTFVVQTKAGQTDTMTKDLQ